MGNLLNTTTSTSATVSADDSTSTFQLAMRIINAVLTFAFGYTFGGDFFPTGHSGLSAAIGGVAFTAIYDYGAYGWDAAGKRSGLSIRQMNIALGMSKASMYSSTLLSVAFLMLTTSLVDLSSIHDTIGLVSVLGTGVLLALHFIQIFAYRRADPGEADAKQQAELRGSLLEFYADQRKGLMDKVQLKVREKMIAKIDDFAELEANREWDAFTSQMGYAGAAAGARQETEEQSKTAPPPPPPTGKDFRDMTDEEKLAEVGKSMTDDGYIDYTELKGNAHAGLQNSLNMAGA
ncbi:MAG: hypothetical protein AAGA31_08640 [Bacteroidota bacterium]